MREETRRLARVLKFSKGRDRPVPRGWLRSGVCPRKNKPESVAAQSDQKIKGKDFLFATDFALQQCNNLISDIFRFGTTRNNIIRTHKGIARFPVHDDWILFREF